MKTFEVLNCTLRSSFQSIPASFLQVTCRCYFFGSANNNLICQITERDLSCLSASLIQFAPHVPPRPSNIFKPDTFPHRDVPSLLPVDVGQGGLGASTICMHHNRLCRITADEVWDHFAESPREKALVHVPQQLHILEHQHLLRFLSVMTRISELPMDQGRLVSNDNTDGTLSIPYRLP